MSTINQQKRVYTGEAHTKLVGFFCNWVIMYRRKHCAPGSQWIPSWELVCNYVQVSHFPENINICHLFFLFQMIRSDI